MKSPVYNEAMAFAINVLNAVKSYGNEMDYPLEEFVNASIRIGASLSEAETLGDPEAVRHAYKEANANCLKSAYWMELLSKLDDYESLSFEKLQKQCSDIQGMITSGLEMVAMLTGKRRY